MQRNRVKLFSSNCMCPVLSTEIIVAPKYRLSGFSYVNKDRNITKRIVQHAERRGVKALFITVDAPQLGRREKVSRITLFLKDPMMMNIPKLNRTCE